MDQFLRNTIQWDKKDFPYWDLSNKCSIIGIEATKIMINIILNRRMAVYHEHNSAVMK